MKCTRCGEEIPSGHVYCSKCGKEVQLVPEYNMLEEELLTHIVEVAGKEALGIMDSSDQDQVNSPRMLDRFKKFFVKRKKWVFLFLTFLFIFLVFVIILLTNHEADQRQKNSFAYQYERAQEAEKDGKYVDALDYYERALSINPDAPEIQFDMADIYIKINKNAMAEALLLKLTHNSELKKEAYSRLIGLYGKDKQYNKIADLMDEVKDSSLLSLFSDYVSDPPYFSRISGTYSNELDITLLTDDDSTIYYTTDGTDPDPGSNGILYSGTIILKEGITTLRAVAVNKYNIVSDIAAATYTISIPAPSDPVVQPPSGTYTEAVAVTLDVPADCKAYYTWDDPSPGTSSAQYTAPIEMMGGEHTFYVVYINSAGKSSNVTAVHYYYQTP